MNKELEALDSLWYGQKTTKNYKILKSALKKLKKIENVMPIDKPELLKPGIDMVNKKLKALEIIKECCECDFIKKEENDKPIRYEIHIRRKDGDTIFFPCLAIYPKSQEEYDLLKEVLL